MTKSIFNDLSAVFINCTLGKSPNVSHTSKLIGVSKGIMERENVSVTEIRLVDLNVPPGVYPDMTEHGWDQDEWPSIFKKVKNADIVVIATPIWLGQISSETKKLIERLDAMSDKTNDKGQTLYYGKVGGCIITGNEDGVKHCTMDILFSLQHLGFSIPPQAACGWIGDIGPGPSYGDTEYEDKKIDPPKGYDSDFTNKGTTFMTYNLLHLAAMLKSNDGYPSYGNSSEDWKNGERWSFIKPSS